MRHIRFPAEWEKQAAIQLTWPALESSSNSLLAQNLSWIAAEISLRQRVLLVCNKQKPAQALLEEAGANLEQILFVEIPSNDIWARDHAWISIYEDSQPKLLNFNFNGWGLKYPAAYDNQINMQLRKQNFFVNNPMVNINLVLEGGSIDTDGQGNLLTTSNCLFSPNRNYPQLSRDEILESLQENLGLREIFCLNHGYQAGDDTDSHIDTLARFLDPQTIAYVSCAQYSQTIDNKPLGELNLRRTVLCQDEHFHELQKMETELNTLAKKHNYRLIPLPIPRPIYDQSGTRLPATYANFLFINGALLVPTYNDPQDKIVLSILQAALPEREIIGIDCQNLILERGSLHCATMQFPEGIIL